MNLSRLERWGGLTWGLRSCIALIIARRDNDLWPLAFTEIHGAIALGFQRFPQLAWLTLDLSFWIFVTLKTKNARFQCNVLIYYQLWTLNCPPFKLKSETMLWDFWCFSSFLTEMVLEQNLGTANHIGYTGCPKKNAPVFESAITPAKMALELKVGWVLKSSGNSLSDEHWNFPIWTFGISEKWV